MSDTEKSDRVTFLESAIRDLVETDAALSDAFASLDGSEAAATKYKTLSESNEAAYQTLQRISKGTA